MTHLFTMLSRPHTFAKSLSFHILAASIATTASYNCTAETKDPYFENWYQVEMVIFKRSNQNSDYDTEVWPKNLILAYPPNIRILKDAQEALTEDSEMTTENELPETTLTSTESTESQAVTIAQDVSAQPEKEQPYTKLDEDQFFIRGADYVLNREPGVTVLFHETWRQPMVEEDKAPALIIRGGDSYGKHTELEGTVTFNLSRYLHIHTNLWLSRFESNYGQEGEHWPDLPSLPQHPSDLPTDLTFNIDIDNSNLSNANLDLTTQQQPSGLDLQLDSQSGGLTFDGNSGFLLNDLSRLTDKPYLVKEIITLRQKRRMRSDELHYIDHPRMGILVKILPYTPQTAMEGNTITDQQL